MPAPKRPPLPSPRPRDTPPLPSETPRTGSPFELVVENVEPDTIEVVMLGLGVIVEEAEPLVEEGEAEVVDAGAVELAVWLEESELAVEAGEAVWLATVPESVVEPAPTPADTRPPPVPPIPSETPPLPRDTPIRGSPLELVVVKVTSEEVDKLGLEVMVELLAGVVELAVWLAPLPGELVDAPSPIVADTRPPPVPPMPRDTPPLPRETPMRGSPLELVVVKVTSEDVERLGLWVMVELLAGVVEADAVDGVVAESEPPPTPAEMSPPPVPPRPREIPPLPRETPIRGSPFEFVVVKVTSDAEVLKLGLWVMVELLLPGVVEADAVEGVVESAPPPTPAEIRPPPVPPMPSDTPPLPSDTPIRGSPLELVVVKVTSDADEDRLGLEVMVESPRPTLADTRVLTPSVTPPSPREMPRIGSPLELVVVKVTSEAVEAAVVLGLEVMVESPRPTLADTRELTPRVTPPSPREMPMIGSPLELVVVKVVSDAVVVLGLEVMVESPGPTLADTIPLTPSVTPPSPREIPIIGSPLELVVVKVTSEAVVEVLGLCVIVELALLLIGPALAEELVVEATEDDELLVLPIGSASEPPLDVEEAGAVEFAPLLIVPALAEELEVMADELVVAGAGELVEFALLLIGPALADELVVAGAEELVEFALLLMGPALADELVAGAEELVEFALLLMGPALAVELLVLLIGPAVASPLDVVELALLLIGPPVDAPLEVGPAEVVELALLVIGPAVAAPLEVDELMVELALLLAEPLAVGIMEEVMFPLMVDERVGLIGPAVAVLLALLLAEPLAVGIIEEVMFPLMVDERDGLIGPAVAELFALLLAEPLAVGIIEVILAELLTEPLAVGIMEEVVFPLMLMVEDRV